MEIKCSLQHIFGLGIELQKTPLPCSPTPKKVGGEGDQRKFKY